MKQLDGTAMKRLHREWRRRTEGRLALILDGLGTPVNVGSIVRSAAAFSVDQLWLAGPTPEVTSAGARKTALGTERYLLYSHTASSNEAIDLARADGYVVLGIELADTSVPLHEMKLADRDVCLVLGHEDHGLSKGALAACDHLAYLPQLGKVGSLNVATAAAIACYEIRRQRW
jgi:tRNA (guanosine-2'-O-)-methyltransferase